MMAVPAMMFVYALWQILSRDSSGSADRGWTWFIGTVVFMIVAVPASIFGRSRIFRRYWQGECVAPRAYVGGMALVWATLMLGGLASLAGCLMTGSFLPSLFPALVAFVVYLTMWPSGQAMICSGRGNTDDPGRYEEPS